LILAGDIGGTKTLLALVDDGETVREAQFASADHEGLEGMVDSFLAGTDHRVDAACFAAAGRVEGRTCRITNLPWTVDADAVGRAFDIPRVDLLNDLQAIAVAVPHLPPSDRHVLVEGRSEPDGVIGVVAPGTGLGIAFLTREGAWPTEGGHATFAPRGPGPRRAATPPSPRRTRSSATSTASSRPGSAT
jgi:glucokinase